jgi:hypothetical protein
VHFIYQSLEAHMKSLLTALGLIAILTAAVLLIWVGRPPPSPVPPNAGLLDRRSQQTTETAMLAAFLAGAQDDLNLSKARDVQLIESLATQLAKPLEPVEVVWVLPTETGTPTPLPTRTPDPRKATPWPDCSSGLPEGTHCVLPLDTPEPTVTPTPILPCPTVEARLVRGGPPDHRVCEVIGAGVTTATPPDRSQSNAS